jgi:hypothetical protein
MSKNVRAAALALAVGALAAMAVPAMAVPAAARVAPARPASPAERMAGGAHLVRNTQRTGIVPGEVLAVMPGTKITGSRLRTAGTEFAARTSATAVNATLAGLGARWVRPLFPSSKLGGIFLVKFTRGTPAQAAARLRATSGVTFAEPDRYVNTMDVQPTPLPALRTRSVRARSVRAATTTALPGNYGYASSLQAYLNSQGDDIGGAYATLGEEYHQLPGAGETITNVSIGDLTDESMAQAGDGYVQANGPTTILSNDQRYLDMPSEPLIPAYVAESDGSLSGTASVEGEDPDLGEVGLDFSVMAPLPDALQRPGETGSGDTDLLGIAPGAHYRLIVPATPTMDEIAQAFIAAANQSPRPDVITASLGFGTDTTGFPGRYLEEDPLMEAVISTVTRDYGIVVVDSANDGTRLYTPTSVGPDGGATPTNVTADRAATTSINDDAESTTPGVVLDSGSIAAGATTLDDTLADPASSNPTYAETRTDGSANFASGFGARITLSAPGDNIVALEHTPHGQADAVTPVLNGGTSASAPEIAAAAAVVLQAARLTHRPLSPAQVTRVLAATGREVATPPQSDQRLHVGPQVDVTAAVDAVLGSRLDAHASIARVSVAHRQVLGEDGAEFLENTDPTNVNLTGNAVNGPITFGADITGWRGDGSALVVDGHVFTGPAGYVRVTPASLLAAAGLPVVSTTSQTISYTFEVRWHRHVLASETQSLTFGPATGTYSLAAAPQVAPVVPTGSAVTVKYDLTGASPVASPELMVSTAGHWNPDFGSIFTAAYTAPLSGRTGTVTVPASAFDDGGGLYGIGIEQAGDVYGQFVAVRVAGFSAATRPAAPLLNGGHVAVVSRAAPTFTLGWDAGWRATGAMLEISAPSPTVYGSLNTFTNQNGTQRDNDGVDAGSVVDTPLPSASGTSTFSAVTLGLNPSVSYNVRVLPTGSGAAVVGQASPSSELTFNDGLPPFGGALTSYSIAGASSVAAVADSEGSQLFHYDPSDGGYGPVIASDTGGGAFDVLGVDATAGTVLVSDVNGQTETVQLYDMATGQLMASLPGYTVLGGRVDATRGRAALLVFDSATDHDEVIGVDMTTGVAGTPIDLGSNRFGDITLDASTGLVYAGTLGGGPCIGAGASNEPIAVVNLDSGTATSVTAGSRCDFMLAADGRGQNLISLNYSSFSLNIAGHTNLGIISQTGPARTGLVPVRAAEGLALAVDGTNHLAAVLFGLPNVQTLFGYPGGYSPDNNAMSEIDIVNTQTGAVVKTIADFVANTSYGLDFFTEQSVQLDPSTMTGYIYAPGFTQIQSFRY